MAAQSSSPTICILSWLSIAAAQLDVSTLRSDIDGDLWPGVLFR